MHTHVWCTTRFTAFHRWSEAPNEVAFLRSFHRHIFHVKVVVAVDHDDRDVEFITLKTKVDNFISNEYADKINYFSCEMFCKNIGNHLMEMRYKVVSVEVSEDGENGATVTW